MNDNVTPINNNTIVLPTFQKEANDDTIDFLERLLKRAKAGEIVSVGIAFLTREEKIGTMASPQINIWTMVGAIERLKMSILEGAQREYPYDSDKA